MSPRSEADEERLAALFREAGWSVSFVERADHTGGLRITNGSVSYVVEVKRSSEARADRVIPLVSQAVLQARKNAEDIATSAPLVVVTGRVIPNGLINRVKAFLAVYAPDVAIGFMDDAGVRNFTGTDLQPLNRPAGRIATLSAEVSRPVDLFSDLSQWLLKTLLATDLGDPHLLNAPKTRYRNASELARGAAVSVMTAVRFLGELKVNGYLDQSTEFIRIVRIDEVFARWRAAVARPARTLRARWLFPGDAQIQMQRWTAPSTPDVCLALYAAADALGLGVARGVPIHVYVRRLPHDLKNMGLVRVASESEAHVIVRVPPAIESVFRGSVVMNGVRSCDVLQTWVDVGHDPVRGREQAEHIYRRVIGPMIERTGAWPEPEI